MTEKYNLQISHFYIRFNESLSSFKLSNLNLGADKKIPQLTLNKDMCWEISAKFSLNSKYSNLHRVNGTQ